MKPVLSTSSSPRKREPGSDLTLPTRGSRVAAKDDMVDEATRRGTARVCLGVVGAPHGVRGAVRIKSFTDEPQSIARYGALEDETGERKFTLRVIGNAKGDAMVLALLSGVADRDRAETLRGLRLYLPRAALPPPGEDEFYHADLVGLAAMLEDGSRLGTVIAVHDFGAGDVLEIARDRGQPVVVPFTRAAVPVVDLAAGRVVLDPPEGLIDPPGRRKIREPA